MKSDDLGDRMKGYEDAAVLMPGLPIVARLDGCNFSAWTRGLDKPSAELERSFDVAAEYFLLASDWRVAYTQSDEITLLWWADDWTKTEMPRGGKVQKLATTTAAKMTAHFEPRGFRPYPEFDCRVFQVPSLDEAVNCLLWRLRDAERNSIQMLAQQHFSPKQMHKKGSPGLIDMLDVELGIGWAETLIPRSRYGRLWVRRRELVPLDAETLAKIPEKHRPDGPIDRSVVREWQPEGRPTFEDVREAIL